MSFEERKSILSAIKYVDGVWPSIDNDGSVKKTIEVIRFNNYINYHIKFVKGGDRSEKEIPEKSICDKLGIKIIDGLGEKIQSSSKLVKNIKRFVGVGYGNKTKSIY